MTSTLVSKIVLCVCARFVCVGGVGVGVYVCGCGVCVCVKKLKTSPVSGPDTYQIMYEETFSVSICNGSSEKL